MQSQVRMQSRPTCRVGRRAVTVRAAAATPSTVANNTEVGAKVAATKIAVFSAKQYVVDFLSPFKEKYFPNTTFIDATLNPTSAKLAAGFDVACLFVNDDCSAATAKVLAEGGVKLIAMRCAGYDRVDVKACNEAGLRVVRVPTYSPTSVAEHAACLMFALARSVHHAHSRVMHGNYALSGMVGMEIFGKTVGVLGTGAIGAEAVRIFHGLGMKVLAYDIRPNPKVEALGVPYQSVEEILPQCDVVSIHVPLLPSTYHFLDKEKVAMLKPGCMVINVSRGGLVDSDAIIEGLDNGQIGALGMDVYENEGSLFFTDWTSMDPSIRMKFWDKKFKTMLAYPQTLFTPHTAFLTDEALGNIAGTTVENITAFMSGQELKNEVKPMP